MADIVHAAGKSDFPHRHVGIFQKFFGIGNPRIDEVILNRNAHVAFKFPGKVVFAYMLKAGKLFEGRVFLKVGVDVFGASLYIGRDIKRGCPAGKIQDKQFCQQA